MDAERLTGDGLRQARESLGLSLAALAGMLAVRPDTVRQWEAGRREVPVRVRDEVAVIREAVARLDALE